jgi:hypothetical protein
MRDEIRRAFDEITEAPHPALRSALRSRLMAGPARQESRVWRMAALGAAVAVVALAVLGGLYMLPRGGGPAPAPAGGGTPTPAASPSPAISPSPSPTAVPSNLPAFACTSLSGGGESMPAPPHAVPNVTDVRVGTASGYDRIVIEFDAAVPAYSVTPQGTSLFMADPSYQSLQLQGSSGVTIVVHGASSTDLNGNQTFKGSQDLKPGYPVLKEARQVGDFERVFSWGLGLSSPNCIRAFTLTGPDRLVIDVESP